MQSVKSAIKSLFPERFVLHLQAIDHYVNGERELRMLRKLCPPGRDAVDAGANIGTYTYFLRKYASQVHAYEPNPSLANRLQRLFPDVNVRNVALSSTARKVALRVPIDSNGAAHHELASIAQEFGSSVQEFSVDAVTLDSEGLQRVGFIKVDVEQHERDVLRGGLQTIERCRPIVMTEVTPLLYEGGLPDAFRFLLDLEYVGWFTYRGVHIPLTSFEARIHADPKEFGHQGMFMGNNMFFFPRESSIAQTGP